MHNFFKGMILLVAVLCLTVNAGYYVNSNDINASDAGSGTSAQPWKTLSPLDNRSFAAGDTIHFARGSSYSGGCRVTASGTALHPITFKPYGTGAAPSFTNSNYSVLNGNVFKVSGDYITFDSLYFTACANCPLLNDTSILRVGAVYGLTGADYLTVKNCEFNDCPIGVYINGTNGVVTNNYLHDCNRFLSNPDWGPIAVVIGNAYAEISYNRCNNYVKVGGNYGADGGFIELDSRYFGGAIHDLKIHHNKTIGNMGFMEVTTAGDSINVWYNVSEDYQEFIFWWSGNNSRMDNNTVIRTRPSNNGAINTVFTMSNTSFAARNNIFVVANSVQVWVAGGGNYGSVLRENNLYYCTDNSTTDPSGKALGTGEKTGNPLFVNLAGGDYHLGTGSPAIDAGRNLGYTQDYAGNTVPVNLIADIGAYESGIADTTDVLASFTATPSSGYKPVTVAFNATASIGRSLTYVWSFGDGTTAAGVTASHTYAAVGTYFAKLVVSNVYNKDSITKVITVNDPASAPLKSIGTPIVSIVSPSGDGSTNLEVIRDNVYPATGNYTVAYDTYDGATHAQDYFGYTFTQTYAFSKVVFHFGARDPEPHGGVFNTGVALEVRNNGTWTTVTQALITPAYNPATAASFDSLVITIPNVFGDAIRVIGAPRDGYWVGCSELDVVGTLPATAAYSKAPSTVNVTSSLDMRSLAVLLKNHTVMVKIYKPNGTLIATGNNNAAASTARLTRGMYLLEISQNGSATVRSKLLVK